MSGKAKETGTAETSLGGGLQVSAAGSTSGGDGSSHLSPDASYNVYETRYQRSLRNYLTRETLPSEAHYRNLESVVGNQRPTIDELHQNTVSEREVGDSTAHPNL
ncbi:hypothetical protein E2C01_047958 [Portunus trituberculatus]|uniref:Uncharacterized protein n=1 Tax=Portunus trituberculatus TaxID=210409 RepID=A0A5B7G2E9_PORTR|nr:hypothetical protein [Portunus trituberculatus]